MLAEFSADGAEAYLAEEGAEDIWSLWLRASKTALLLEQCIQTAEPAYLAKHAFQMAQDFNNFYHRHHILTEEDAGKKQLLLATAAVAQRELIPRAELAGNQGSRGNVARQRRPKAAAFLAASIWPRVC